MLKRTEPLARNIERSVDYNSKAAEMKQRSGSRPRGQQVPSKQMTSLFSNESLSDDDEHSKNLAKLAPEEREQRNRRLQALEKRSKNRKVSTMEASKMDLTSLIENREWKYVMRKVGSDPKSMSTKREVELDGSKTIALPLHLTVSQRPPLNVVDGMIAAYPAACRIPDETHGQLPLHIACKFRASGEVLKCIMDAYPDAVKLTDTLEKRVPLHYACFDGYPNDVSMLMSAEKRTLTAVDSRGKTPVDLCQESTNPHRDSILKRIYEVSKGYDTSSAPRSKTTVQSKRRNEPLATPMSANDQKRKPPPQSPSDVTVTTSNVSKKSTGKTKSVLPTWARGRKGRSETEMSTRSRGSSLETPRSRTIMPHSKTRGSSLERLRNRRKAHEKRSRGLGETALAPSKGEAQASPVPGRNRTKKTRSREDSVATLAISYSDSIPQKRGTPVEKARAPASVNDVVDKASQPDPSNAPTSGRPKNTTGLTSTTDLMSYLDEEERRASKQEFGDSNVHLLTLPPVDSQGQWQGDEPEYQSMPELPRGSSKTTVRQSEKEALYHSMPALSHPTATSSSRTEKVGEMGASLNPDTQTILTGQAGTATEKLPSTASEGGGGTASADIETKQHHLELRKAALVAECNHVSESIMKKRARAQMSKSKISLLESQIRELQETLDKEKKSLEYANSGIKVHEEIMAEHEAKIKSVDQELLSLTMILPSSSSNGTPSSSGTTASSGSSSSAASSSETSTSST